MNSKKYLDDQHINDPRVTNSRILIEFLSQSLSALLGRNIKQVELNTSRNLNKDE